ncbi:MAG: hypothetical protein ACF8XB_00560 [Planctomycetota bacterium JB042]
MFRSPTLLRAPILLLAAVALPLLGRAAPAQDVGEPLCGDCQTTGKVAHAHSSAALEQEEGVIFCSAFMRSDPEALGMDWIVCPKCRTPSVQEAARAEFDREFGRRKKWLEDREANVDAHAGHEVEHIRTKHFLIAFDLPKTKVGRRVLRTHDAIHLYAQRLEELHAQMLMIHGITERNTAGLVHEIYIFEKDLTTRRVGNHVLSAGMGNGFRKSQYGRTSQHITSRNKKDFRKDEDFHQALVHSVSHLITNEIGIQKTWLLKRYGWVHVGMAHWFEIRNFGPPNTWCHQEQGNFVHWKGDSWEANVKKALAAGDEVKFQAIVGRASETLDSKDHQFAWSFVDYLMWLDPHKMVKFLTLLKGPQLEDRDALKQAYGITVGQFVDGWTEFVKTHYSSRPSKGPRVLPPKGSG